MSRVFFFLDGDLINGQLTTAECTACQTLLWLGGSPPFCGLGLLCPRFLPLSSASLCLHQLAPAGRGRKEEEGKKEGKKGKAGRKKCAVCLTG